MARKTYLFFSLTHLSISAAQSYTSLEDMPAWKTLPPIASNVLKLATSGSYAGCVTSAPQISTAACFATLSDMSSSLLSSIVFPGLWFNTPTQFQASATSVAKEWYGQPAVEAVIGTPTPTQTPTKISSSLLTSSNSAVSTDTSTPVRKGSQRLSTTALISTILSPIIGIVAIIVSIVLYRKGKFPFKRKQTVGTQSHRRWPSDRSLDDSHQEGATNTMNSTHGRGHLVPTTNFGSRSRTSNRIGDRLNFHFYPPGGNRRDETPLRRDPRRYDPEHASDDDSEGSASGSSTRITWPSRPAIRGPSSRY